MMDSTKFSHPAGVATPACKSFTEALRSAGLCGPKEQPLLTPLVGGVSSDIFRVDVGARTFAAKRALERLAVALDWRAPITRNHSEVDWLNFAASVVPANVPKVLAHFPESNFFVMEYLPQAQHPTWKSSLLAGECDAAFAAAVGEIVARIHQSSAGRPEIAERFANDSAFHALRLDPYLEATASRHPDIGPQLLFLSRETLSTHKALVHGDVSPKNILQGRNGPVLIDAECAWYGDPAFDVAFCLNHLLLKCIPVPDAAQRFLAAFEALAQAYLKNVRWEAPEALEARAARLLPALTLARIDGKSPVEYITDDDARDLVRATAIRLIRQSSKRLDEVRAAWSLVFNN